MFWASTVTPKYWCGQAQVGVSALAAFAQQVGRPVTGPVQQQIDDNVRRAAYRIIEGKGAAYFSVAATLARIVQAIRDDEKQS